MKMYKVWRLNRSVRQQPKTSLEAAQECRIEIEIGRGIRVRVRAT